MNSIINHNYRLKIYKEYINEHETIDHILLLGLIIPHHIFFETIYEL